MAACSPNGDQGNRDEQEQPSQVQAPRAPNLEIQPDVRQVIPGRALHVPQPGEQLERLPAPVLAPPPPRAVNLGIVVVEGANRLSTARGPVRLLGTRAVDPTVPCQMADGRAPACAMLARTAVRQFVGQRSVSCVLGTRVDAGADHVAPCMLGQSDLSLWVVAQGWAFAEPYASADMQGAQTVARQERRGFWAMDGPHLP